VRSRNDINTASIQFQWNPNTFRGFVAALIFFAVLMVFSMCTKVSAPEPYATRPSYGLVEVRFGDGDGTGARKGNLSREGQARKGPDGNPLEDAQAAASAKNPRTVEDPMASASHRTVAELGKKGTASDVANSGDADRGAKDGATDGTGLGWAGSGPGKGLGLGDIDWGGGGNRTVLKKELPRFPAGTLNTEVKLRFRVRPDGTVSWVMPLRRGGNPAVDNAAITAMYKWRFNPLSTDTEMEGTITFVFKNR